LFSYRHENETTLKSTRACLGLGQVEVGQVNFRYAWLVWLGYGRLG
jgi:hypothetical protein